MYLESVFVTASSSELSGDVSKFVDRNLIPFANPFLENGRRAPLRKSQSENPAPQIVFLLWFLDRRASDCRVSTVRLGERTRFGVSNGIASDNTTICQSTRFKKEKKKKRQNQ